MKTISVVSPPGPFTSNPFATRFTSPGRLPPLDSSGDEIDTDALLVRFESCGNSAAICGPHGSGKSTLLVALADRLRRDGRLGGLVRLGGGFRRDVPAVARGLAACERGQVLCVDSWERLGGGAATLACIFAVGTGRGLLVTAHIDGWLPTLVSCSTSPQLLSRIVDRLPDRFGLLGDSEIKDAFKEADGNLREALFLLYDRFERGRNLRFRSQRS